MQDYSVQEIKVRQYQCEQWMLDAYFQAGQEILDFIFFIMQGEGTLREYARIGKEDKYLGQKEKRTQNERMLWALALHVEEQS